MKKNSFLTFIFSLIPGSGQMYLGYMKRGVSIMLLFGASFTIGTRYVNDLVIIVLAIWAYSFFDTWNLRNNLRGAPQQVKDDFIFATLVTGANGIDDFAKNYYKIIGYSCIGIAALIFINSAVIPLIGDFVPSINQYQLSQTVNTAVFAGLLVWLGIFLLKKNNTSQTQQLEDDYVSYGANNNDEENNGSEETHE